MKQYEKIVILMAALIVIVVIGSFFDINIPVLNEKPSFEFSNQSAIKSTMPDERCYIEFNATLANAGGPADGIIVKAEVIGALEKTAGTVFLPIAALEKGGSQFFTGTVTANESCETITRVKLGIESYK